MSQRTTGVAIALLALGGAVGCGDHLPSSTDPKTLAVGPEGIPIGLALPVASGSCTLTDQSGTKTTASWDSATRTFTLGTLTWRLDDQARVVEYGEPTQQWRHLMTRDEHGVITAFTYEWQGAVSAMNSWDQTNSYDSAGHLTGTEQIFRDGSGHLVNTYQYEAALLASSTQHSERQGTASDTSTQYTWSDGRLQAREFSSTLRGYSRETRTFDDAGRLIRVEVDGAGLAPVIDGTPDLRSDWSYDAAGRVARTAYDGTEALDAPVVDGISDGTIDYDAACAGLAVLPNVLYSFQSWLPPG